MSEDCKAYEQNVFTGVLHILIEQGDDEGAYWALVDTRYARGVPVGYCKKCGKGLREQAGNVRFVRAYLIDDEFRRTGKLTERPDCPDDMHEEAVYEDLNPEGCHYLEDGDHLTIYAKDDKTKVVWCGVVKQSFRLVLDPKNMQVHTHVEQEGVDPETWKRWFSENHPATLIVGDRDFMEDRD